MQVTQRFESKYTPEPNSGCWLWTGATSKQGYGSFRYKNKTEKAHRVSFALSTGGNLPDLNVLHRCDNPCCVNPAHLFLGTLQDNMVDMVAKGRNKTRAGIDSHFTKLQEKEVLYIKEFPVCFGSGSYLSKLFNISQTQISDIRNGKAWRSL